MLLDQLKPNVIVRGPIFPEPVQVIVAIPMGTSVKLVGKGLNTNQVHEPILSAEQLAQLVSTPEKEPFDGDPLRFRLGIEALRLGLAYEYDPYFSLSIARVDPLPHQLEAVYDYSSRCRAYASYSPMIPVREKPSWLGYSSRSLRFADLSNERSSSPPPVYHFNGSGVSRVEDAKDSLLRSRWDLIIVDEAHKMAAYSADKKTLAYRLGESLSGMTDHFLLMTATPHKGDPENFCLFLELLDRDVYEEQVEESVPRKDSC